MMWAFVSGLLMLAGAHYSASRHALRLAREAGSNPTTIPNPISKIADDRHAALALITNRDVSDHRERTR
jgi:hypothetical protein